MNEKHYRIRILLTVLCLLIALCAFFLPPSPYTTTIKLSDTKSISSTHDYGAKFFEWVGLLFLALTVWIWRQELKLTGFGPLAGEPLTQQTPNDFRKSEKDTELDETIFIQDFSSVSKQMEQEEFEARKKAILELLKKRHAVNVSLVANELRVSSHTAKVLLFTLVKEGKVRCDGFPRQALYTLTSSIENLAIDHVRDLIEENDKIDYERRFVRVRHRFEVDAVFESGQTKFIVEVKFVKSIISPSRLNDLLNRFISVAHEFKEGRIVCYLVLVVFDRNIFDSIQDEVKKLITYDTGDIETRILVLSKDKLKKNHRTRRST